MATVTKKEIAEHLKIALNEVGEVKPWYDKEVDCWFFTHPNYPVSCGEDSAEEVIQKYPLYLEEFIAHRLSEMLSPLAENITRGKGGVRPGAGRPKGSMKEPTKQVRLPIDLVIWFQQDQNAINQVRDIMHKMPSGGQIANHTKTRSRANLKVV